MTSLVTDLLVNPVLRQARRFSLSRSSNPPEPDSSLRAAQACLHSQQDDVISETEEDSSLRDDPGDSASSRRSSRSSVLISPRVDSGPVEENCSGPGDTIVSTDSVTSDADPCVSDSQTGLSSANRPDMSTPEPPSSPLLRGIVEDHSLLPEDDGMGLMRKRILDIQAKEIGHSEKAHLMHQLLIEKYTNSRSHVQAEQPLSPLSPRFSEKRASQNHRPLDSFKFWQSVSGEAEDVEKFDLTDKDLEPTFVPKKQAAVPIADAADTVDIESDDETPLGCEHYRRNVKLQCSTCHRWYTCRFCHDKVEDHNLIRKETRNMLCLDPQVIEADMVERARVDSITTDVPVRDMRRRHSSRVTGSAFMGADPSSFPPDRQARSVSPIPTPGRSLHASMVRSYFDLEEEEEDGDILGFWSRLPRSKASNDGEDDDAADSSDEMTSEEEMEDEEGEESEDDDFELLGHR
ncbi:hypothetical protein GQX73_g8133 [Xylaria multiplex]|uniref:CHY-type domain-containing protein n=1 Tax=Xylaria multiplex TaxID=323545 RepID=A0A7C8MIE9_9PEZI|nr:hypothetical protein GQX73_g8133 [Xylaria multiplex]